MAAHTGERELAGASPMPREEYGNAVEDAQDGSPSPYDVAPPGTPDNRVITKGEREKPGPTEDEFAQEGEADQA